jgi:hypothetical protein
MLDARAVALQGIGFGVLPIAVQGFAEVSTAYYGGGGGAAGVGSYRTPHARRVIDPGLDHEELIRAEIIREDEEILAVIMSAVTSGALKWVH